jgi:hypothetical protein
MARVSNDSNIIYFNPDTANVWRGGGGGSVGLQEVLTANNNASSINNFNLTLAEFQDGGDALKVFDAYLLDKPYIKSELYFGQAGEPYFNFGIQDPTDPGNQWYSELRPSGLTFKNSGDYYKNTLASPFNNNNDFINTLPLATGILALSVNNNLADANGNITISTGGVSGSGTTDYLPKFTGTSSIGNSIMQEVGGNAIQFGSTSASSTAQTILSSARSDYKMFSGGNSSDYFGFYSNGGAYGSTYAQMGLNDGLTTTSEGSAIYFDTRNGVDPLRLMYKPTSTTTMSQIGRAHV